MKKRIGVFLLVVASLTYIGCSNPAEPEPETSGKLTVEISNATNFTGYSIYYSIYDTNSTDPITGGPTGTILGQAKLIIDNNAGSVITATSITDPTEKVFDNGTYYLGGMVDMNDNAATTNYFPDSGDRYGGFVTVEINGNTTHTLTENDFPLTIP